VQYSKVEQVNALAIGISNVAAAAAVRGHVCFINDNDHVHPPTIHHRRCVNFTPNASLQCDFAHTPSKSHQSRIWIVEKAKPPPHKHAAKLCTHIAFNLASGAVDLPGDDVDPLVAKRRRAGFQEVSCCEVRGLDDVEREIRLKIGGEGVLFVVTTAANQTVDFEFISRAFFNACRRINKNCLACSRAANA
jgi:hypothetical protein